MEDLQENKQINADRKARLIAYYLPQFHPIPENDEHWGKDFTEWTNVKKAKPLFSGHYQPFKPTELGYYDLRDPDVRKAQADLARDHGIEGFCYWHYWFAGKRLLELPFNEVVATGKPDFPFCLCWANHSWTATWMGDSKRIIVEQTYPGTDDYTAHFYELLHAFKDRRYMKVNGALIFSIFAPAHIPDCKVFTDLWRTLAKKEGLKDFHFIGISANESDLVRMGLDAATPISPHPLLSRQSKLISDRISFRLWGNNWAETKSRFWNIPKVYKYKHVAKVALREKYFDNEH